MLNFLEDLCEFSARRYCIHNLLRVKMMFGFKDCIRAKLGIPKFHHSLNPTAEKLYS